MISRLFLVLLILVLPVSALAQADMSIGGGGTGYIPRQQNSNTWYGPHNNVPRCLGLRSGICDSNGNLIPNGTVFTPPTSFGNWWILNNAASQSVACVPNIADGDGMDIVVIGGSGAPYSPPLSFAQCYGDSNGNTIAVTNAVSSEDDYFCFAKSPAPANGSSFTCGVQQNVKGVSPAAWVQGAVGTSCHSSGTTCSVTLTNPIAVGNTVACFAAYDSASNVLTGFSDGTNSLTLLDNHQTTGSSHWANDGYLLNEPSSGKTTITATLSVASAFLTVQCDEYKVHPSGTVLDAHAVNQQTSPGTGTDAVTSGTATTLANDILWGATLNDNGSGTLAVVAGTGFTLNEGDETGLNFAQTTERLFPSSAGATAARFTAIANSTANWVTFMMAFQ